MSRSLPALPPGTTGTASLAHPLGAGVLLLRWQVEVTFAEVRRHLGVETQRQWSDLAIARTTPALLGLFSLVTLWAGATRGVQPRSAAWYPKPRPTFSDALAAVRHHLRSEEHTSELQ